MAPHVETVRFRRGETCTEDGCPAKKYYIENGKKTCTNGHEQFGFTQTQQDEDDWNATGKKSRKKKEEQEKVETILSGNEARELYLQCYQLILWKQCNWLVSTKGFPSELETVVRDLWDLRTRSLQMRDGATGYGSTIGGTHLFSSQGEETDYETDESGARSTASRRSKRSTAVTEEKLPKLVEMLGLCYLGTLMLRLPTSLGEIFNWAIRDEIVFTRAIKDLPKEMRSKLPAQYHNALQLHSPLKEAILHGTVLELIEFFHAQFEIVFPPLNNSLLLFKHVRDLGLPIEIIPAVKRLSQILNIDFTFPLTHSAIYRVTAYPEIQLMSLIIIAVKLGHPFDNVSRLPVDEADPTTVKIDWVAWARIMAEKESGLKRGDEIKVRESEAWKMDESEMDGYLDWFQRTWVDEGSSKMPTQILELFPLPHLSPKPIVPDPTKASIAKLQSIHRTLIVQQPWPEPENGEKDRAKRAGEMYKRYRKVEELPSVAKPFFEFAAQNAGISVKMLVRGVFLLERQIQVWLEKERKSQARGHSKGKGRDEEESSEDN